MLNFYRFLCWVVITLGSLYPVQAIHAQMQKWGAPVIQNYLPKDYQSNPQNWSAVKDNRGVMYFGNDVEIVEFDGQHFRHIEFAKPARVRSLLKAPDGTIYYGSVGEFGYLKIHANGKIEPQSLMHLVPKGASDFNDVWSIEYTSYGVYFMTAEDIYILHDNKIEVLAADARSSAPIVLNDKLFYMDSTQGISMIDGNQIIRLPQKEEFKKSRVLITSRNDHELLILPINSTFYTVDLSSFWNAFIRTYQITPDSDLHYRVFSTPLQTFAPDAKSIFYKIKLLPNGEYAICSVKAGVFIMGKNGEFVRNINAKMGLPDNTVLNVFPDAGSLWVLSNSGVSHIELQSGKSSFGEPNGIKGTVISLAEYKNKLYVGTFQNLLVSQDFKYKNEEDLPQFKPLLGEASEIWEFLEKDDKLLIATGAGLMELGENDTTRRIFPEKTQSASSVFTMASSTLYPNYLFVGGYGGISVLKKEKGEWKPAFSVRNFEKNITYLNALDDGNLLIYSDRIGSYLLKFTGKTVHDYEILPIRLDDDQVEYAYNITPIEGKLWVPTQKGVFEAKLVQNGRLMKAELSFPYFLGKEFEKINNKQAIRVSTDKKGGYLIQFKDGVVWLQAQIDGRFNLVSDLFANTPDTDFMYRLADQSIWTTGKQLNRFDIREFEKRIKPMQPLIRKVRVNQTEDIFLGTLADEKTIFDKNKVVAVSQIQSQQEVSTILPYKKNSLLFEFAIPLFEKQGSTQFQYQLEGFDSAWSSWGNESYKEYTNIPEGKYRFLVRAKDIFGQESPVVFYAFEIQAPWYRTWWAYFLWLILAISLIALIIHIYTLRLVREKTKLEAIIEQRTQQIRNMALIDPLTGLRNRRFISDVLQMDVKAFWEYQHYLQSDANSSTRLGHNGKEVFGVFLLDIDKFKEVNDIYGHDAGDAVLKQFAHILVDLVRPDDVIVRLGGEEFLIVLKNTQPDYLHQFASNILQAIASHSFDLHNGTHIQKTCSIGYTQLPFYAQHLEVLSLEQCMSLADLAMYKSKHDGRNRANYVEAGQSAPSNELEAQRMASSAEYGLQQGLMQFSKETLGPKIL